MQTHADIERMLWQLADEIPQMMENPDTFFSDLEYRASEILQGAAPEDHAFVGSVIETFVEDSGINETPPLLAQH